MATQREKATSLRNLHRRGEPLLLINVWDAVSARIIEQLGFPAIATTSAGIAWREGFADGERIPRQRMLDAVASITAAVGVAVTADLEAAYGPTVDDAIQTAKGAIAAGAVGLNFEDWDAQHERLMDADAQIARIAAMRKAGDEADVPLVINARTDVFLKKAGDSDAWRIQESVRRGNSYLDAGADCVFVPGVTEEETIATLAAQIPGPINVLAAPGMPTVARLSALGVARISVGGAAMASVLAQLGRLASDVNETGRFEFTADRISHADLNALFP